MKLEREIEGIETVGALREALADLGLVDAVPIGDMFLEPIMVSLYRDSETSQVRVGIQ
ncbi:MAG: hypothetical protein V1791_04975 [Pseudomonadota bacterium]